MGATVGSLIIHMTLRPAVVPAVIPVVSPASLVGARMAFLTYDPMYATAVIFIFKRTMDEMSWAETVSPDLWS